MMLKLDLHKNPNNERAKQELEKLEKEREWYKTMIKEGKDPGAHIL
jgi:hypothetical protein